MGFTGSDGTHTRKTFFSSESDQSWTTQFQFRRRKNRPSRGLLALLTALAVFGVAAAGAAGSVASASAEGSASRTLSTPVQYQPKAINRKSLGGPIPNDAKIGEERRGLAGAGVEKEVVERRSESTQTFLTEEGYFETYFYGAPINYKDSEGKWRPIDSTLVESSEPGYALRNTANRISVALPSALDKAPVKVTAAGRSVGFSLQGATGSPKAEKTSATYHGAIPGVNVTYSATNEGLKEELVLSRPGVPATYDFTVALSEGLAAKETKEGGIALTDNAGAVWARFTPPFVFDDSYTRSGSEDGFSTDAVSLDIISTAPQLVMRLAVNPSWLSDPKRVWPVTIDPTLALAPSQDTFITTAAPDSPQDTNPKLAVSGGTAKRRTLIRPTTDLASYFKEPVEIRAGGIDLYADTDTTGFAAVPAGIHEVTSEWAAPNATWNQRQAGVPWTTPGGDFVAEPDSVNSNITGPAGYRKWFLSAPLVRKWVEDGVPNRGLLVKYEDETSAPTVTFASSANFTNKSRMRVQWEPIHAFRDPYQHQSFKLGERRNASVNLVSGNLIVKERDLSLSGTGLETTVDRFYVSRPSLIGSVGARWRMWPQSEERLTVFENGAVGVASGPNLALYFDKNPDGTFASPHGFRGSMVKEPDGTFTLSLHEDGTKYRFGTTGYPSEIVDQNGNKITFGYQYDAASGAFFMVSMTDTQGRVTTFERIGQHKVSKMTDPAGRTHRYGYSTDQYGNPLLVSYVDPAGKETRYEYSNDNYVSKMTDPNGNITTFGYSRVNRGGSDSIDTTLFLTSLTRVTDPSTGTGPTWNFDYNTSFQTKVTDPNGRATTHFFDRKGRTVKVVDAAGNNTQASYTSNSFVSEATDQMNAKTSFGYDPRDNMKQATSPTGAKDLWDYDDVAHPFYSSRHTSAQANKVAYTYDGPGNLTDSQNDLANENNVKTDYNLNGTVAKITDAKGNFTLFGYDPKGNLTSVDPPLGVARKTFEYDGLSRITKSTDAKGQATNIAYDAMDRVTQLAFADGTSTVNTYDSSGNLTKREEVKPGGLLGPAVDTTLFTYDRLNRPTSKKINGDSAVTASYDGVGNLKTHDDGGGNAVGYDYNELNLLTTLTEPGGAQTRFEYDKAGRRTKTTYPNGVAQTVTYDASGRQTSITGKNAAGTVLTSFTYSYTNPATGLDAGLRYSMTDTSGTTNYRYDALDRLVEASGPLGLYQYSYDGTGNRLTQTINGAASSYAYNAADQLTTAGSTTYSYDANGNLTSQGEGSALSYNAKDQNVSFQPSGAGATTTEMAYLGTGQDERTKAGISTFRDGLLGLANRTDGLLAATNYTRDSDGNLVSQRFTLQSSNYYLFDGLGSVVALTDSTGAVVNRYVYDPYGNPATGTTETVSNPWQFAGGYKDSFSGYYKFGTRYYDSTLGRWTQPDPSGQDANPYSYAGNCPINFVDGDGLKAKKGFEPSKTTDCKILNAVGGALTLASLASFFVPVIGVPESLALSAAGAYVFLVSRQAGCQGPGTTLGFGRSKSKK